jgi:hypothetical protein
MSNISTCGTDGNMTSSILTCGSGWVHGDSNGLRIFKVKGQGHGEIDTGISYLIISDINDLWER